MLQAPKRLAALALLASSEGTDFAYLRDHLRVSDSDLSKQMSALEAAGYVTVSKSGRGRGSATTFRATRAARAAYKRHRTALRALLAEPTGDPDHRPT